MRQLLCLLLWLSASAFAADEEGYGVIRSEDFHIGHVSIGDSYRHVVTTLGKPLREKRTTAQPDLDIGESVVLHYAGLDVSIFDGEVGEIVLTTKAFAVKGVRVGSKASDAITQIGPAKPITIKDRTSLRYRSVTKTGVVTDAELRLFLLNDKIVEISLWFPTM